MGVKRLNLDPVFQPGKRVKALHSYDWLSGLPDDVLVAILSSLPLREAVRTSLLSSRWTNLWTHSLCLDFDPEDALDKITRHPKQRYVERRKYINRVNSVLRSHQAPTLEEFKICFHLDKSNSKAITLWLQFALARGVQKLEVVLVEYDFAKFLGRKAPSSFGFKSLKVLCLRCVYMSGKDIDLFLRNCPFLEQLFVQGLFKSDVEICGSSLALKYVEFFDYDPYWSIVKISAPNLTSLKVKKLSGLLLDNVPMLVDLSLMCSYRCLYNHKLFRKLNCCISQLEMLTLDLTSYEFQQKPELCEFPQMPKLNKLNAEYLAWDDQSLVVELLTYFIRASPHLQELELKMKGSTLWRNRGVEYGGIVHFPHQRLKVLKLEGCDMGATEIEFVRNILANCVALRKIIIDPHFQPSCLFHQQPTAKDIHRQETTRSYVKQHLQPHLPHHIQLLLL